MCIYDSIDVLNNKSSISFFGVYVDMFSALTRFVLIIVLDSVLCEL